MEDIEERMRQKETGFVPLPKETQKILEEIKSPKEESDLGPVQGVIPLTDIENLSKEPTAREAARELARRAGTKAENALEVINPGERLKQAARAVQVRPIDRDFNAERIRAEDAAQKAGAAYGHEAITRVSTIGAQAPTLYPAVAGRATTPKHTGAPHQTGSTNRCQPASGRPLHSFRF